VIVEWKIATDATIIKSSLQRNLNNSTWSEIQSFGNPPASGQYRVEDRDLPAGFYQYRIKLLLANGSVIFSNISTVNIAGISSLILFPNPVSSLLSIVHPFEAGTELSIMDAMGNQVLNKKILSSMPRIRLDISFLSPGVYRVATGKSSSCFVVQ
jgi:hypothetical protein